MTCNDKKTALYFLTTNYKTSPVLKFARMGYSHMNDVVNQYGYDHLSCTTDSDQAENRFDGENDALFSSHAFYDAYLDINDLLRTGRKEDALKKSSYMVATMERHPLSLILHADVLLKNSKLDMALAVLKEALMHPTRYLDISLRLQYSKLLIFKGRYREARSVLKKGIQILDTNRAVMVISEKLFLWWKMTYISLYESIPMDKSKVAD